MEPDQENPQSQQVLPQMLLLHQQNHDQSENVGMLMNGSSSTSSSSSSSKSGSSSYMCRQSSSRWTPTSDQIRILKDLYYNNGVRSPSAEQIQRISARLRQYGKIEGKNVFYWFQNHKARERQKKRFTVEHHHHMPMPMPMQHQRGGINNVGWKQPEQNQMDIHSTTTKYINTPPNISPGVSCPSSPSSHGVFSSATVGQINGCNGYGSLLMEKSFRDCSISAGGSSVVGPLTNNMGWVGPVGIDHHEHHSYHDLLIMNKTKSSSSVQICFQDNVAEPPPPMETLPLFPIHREEDQDMPPGFCIDGNPSSSNWYVRSSNNDHEHIAPGCCTNSNSRTSLELSLNSYSTGMSPDDG